MIGNHIQYPTIQGRSPIQAYARRVTRALADKDAAALVIEDGQDKKWLLAKDVYYSITSRVTIDTPRLVSISYDMKVWKGASHPFSHFDACTVGLVHGRPKILTVHDLFRNRVDANKTAERAALAALAQSGMGQDLQHYKKVTDAPGLVHSFFITRTAIVFVLNEHTVLAHHLAWNTDERNSLARVPFSWLKAKIQPLGPISKLTR